MCLKLRTAEDPSLKPYNKGKIRWKMAYLSRAGIVRALHRGNRYSRKGWMVAKGDENNPKVFGFHVFTSLKSCGKPYKRYSGGKKVNLKVEVDGFLRSGTFNTKPCETWSKMRILKVIRK